MPDTNYYQVGSECPKCHKGAVFAILKAVVYKGKTYEPEVKRCSLCGWQSETDEEAAKRCERELGKQTVIG